MEGDKSAIIKVVMENDLKEELEKIAMGEGYSLSAFAGKVLSEYIRDYYLKKAQTYYNIEERIETSLFLQLSPEIEGIKNILMKMQGMIKKVVWNKKYERKKWDKKEGMAIYRREDEKKEVENIPQVPGLSYRIEGNDVIYDDGSVYNKHLGMWMVVKEKVREWKKKNKS